MSQVQGNTNPFTSDMRTLTTMGVLSTISLGLLPFFVRQVLAWEGNPAAPLEKEVFPIAIFFGFLQVPNNCKNTSNHSSTNQSSAGTLF